MKRLFMAFAACSFALFFLLSGCGKDSPTGNPNPIPDPLDTNVVWHAPQPPASVSAVSPSTSSIRISWNRSDSATAYIVYRSANNATFDSIAQVTDTVYTDQNLLSSTAYYYRIAAKNPGGSSSQTPVSATATTQTPVTAGWSVAGGAPLSAGAVEFVSLATSGTAAYVAYSDDSQGDKATVRKFDAGAWSTAGTAGFTPDYVSATSLGVTGGIPYLALADGNSLEATTVMKFDGTAWSNVGSPGFSVTIAVRAALAFSNGIPAVCYIDNGDGNKVKVRKFEGGAWNLAGGGSLSTGASNYISFASSSSGVLYAAFDDNAFGGRVFVKKLDPAGLAWTAVDTAISLGKINAVSLSLAGEVPYIAFSDELRGYRLVVQVWTGSAWSYVGGEINGTSVSSGAAASISLTVITGKPYVAYSDGANGIKLCVKAYNSVTAQWEAVGNSLGLSTGAAEFINIGNAQGKLWVAFRDGGQNQKAVLMRYE